MQLEGRNMRPKTNLSRREYNKLIGLGAIGGVSAIAGCSSGDGDGSDGNESAGGSTSDPSPSSGSASPMSFKELRETWERKAPEGSLEVSYDAEVVKEYNPTGEPAYEVEDGDLIYHDNTTAMGVHVWDAITGEYLAGNTIEDVSGGSHQTSASPDGKYRYISDGISDAGSLMVVDSRSLEPVKKFSVGTAGIHHGKIFQDEYMLFDKFAGSAKNYEDEGVPTVFLWDPEAEEVVGGIDEKDLSDGNASAYTAWVGPTEEYIYLLMEPEGGDYFTIGHAVQEGNRMGWGYWIAKIDPDNWEVVDEIPYPGVRAAWLDFDSSEDNVFISSSFNDTLVKVSLNDGSLQWGCPTGPGPYANAVSPDDEKVFVANKGEGRGFGGDDMIVIDAEEGTIMERLETPGSGHHVVSSPNGEVMWGSCDQQNVVHTIDIDSHETLWSDSPPDGSGPHGMAFVYHDSANDARTVTDMNGGHMGVSPKKGNTLDIDHQF